MRKVIRANKENVNDNIISNAGSIIYAMENLLESALFYEEDEVPYPFLTDYEMNEFRTKCELATKAILLLCQEKNDELTHYLMVRKDSSDEETIGPMGDI